MRTFDAEKFAPDLLGRALSPNRVSPNQRRGIAHDRSIIAIRADAFGAQHRGEGCALPMKLDIEKYMHHLDGMDLSEAEKIEFIQTLWLIAQCFVADAFKAKAASAKSHISQLKSGFEAVNVIDLDEVRQDRAAPANDNFASKRETGAA